MCVCVCVCVATESEQLHLQLDHLTLVLKLLTADSTAVSHYFMCQFIAKTSTTSPVVRARVEALAGQSIKT